MRVPAWLKPPVFDGDEERTLRARLLDAYMVMIGASLALVMLSVPFDLSIPRSAYAILIGTLGAIAALRVALRRGYVETVAWLVVGLGVASIGATLWMRQTLLTTGTAGYLLVVVMGGLLLGTRGTLVSFILCAGSGVGVFFLERAGVFTATVERTTLADVVTIVVLSAVAGFNVTWALSIVTRSMKKAKAEAIERLRAEDSLRAAMAQRESVEEQLRQAQKMEAVGRLAGGVAHDFNNLLTAISGYADLLLQRRDFDESARHDLGLIGHAASQAASVTQQLLAFSRKQVLEARVLDLNAIVADMQDMLRRLIGEDIRLTTAPASDLGAVHTDVGQVQQVIMNLVVNARDAMPKGGTLTIETNNVLLDENYCRNHPEILPGAYVMLAVSDNGVGMSNETMTHLFEPFFTTKPKGKGTGLGLATVHGIVKQSGGSVSVYSEEGDGTTVKIYLPRYKSLPDVTETPSASLTACTGTETVLLVEDEELIIRLAERILTRFGYTVLTAGNAEAALKICEARETPVDIIVTDVIMPGGMSGRDLARRVAVLYPTVKVLYVSGYTDNAIVHHGLLDPGLHFLAKPFSVESLSRKVREVLDSSQ